MTSGVGRMRSGLSLFAHKLTSCRAGLGWGGLRWVSSWLVHVEVVMME